MTLTMSKELEAKVRAVAEKVRETGGMYLAHETVFENRFFPPLIVDRHAAPIVG